MLNKFNSTQQTLRLANNALDQLKSNGLGKPSGGRSQADLDWGTDWGKPGQKTSSRSTSSTRTTTTAATNALGRHGTSPHGTSPSQNEMTGSGSTLQKKKKSTTVSMHKLLIPHIPNDLTLYPHQLCKIVTTFFHHFDSKATSVPRPRHMQTCPQNSHKIATKNRQMFTLMWAEQSLIRIFCTGKNTHYSHIMR